jgi:hypothetical protein
MLMGVHRRALKEDAMDPRCPCRCAQQGSPEASKKHLRSGLAIVISSDFPKLKLVLPPPLFSALSQAIAAVDTYHVHYIHWFTFAL